MEKTKKGIQIDFCAEEEASSYTTLGFAFATLGTTFSSMDGFPWVITMFFLLLGVILPGYEFCTKVADKTAVEVVDTKEKP